MVKLNLHPCFDKIITSKDRPEVMMLEGLLLFCKTLPVVTKE